MRDTRDIGDMINDKYLFTKITKNTKIGIKNHSQNLSVMSIPSNN
jgi:hypothetical protein